MGIISRIFRKKRFNPSKEGRLKLLRFLTEERQFMVHLGPDAETALWLKQSGSSNIIYFSKDGTPKYNSPYFSVEDSVDTVIKKIRQMLKDGQFRYEVGEY